MTFGLRGMSVGFTGTQMGMTQLQRIGVERLLTGLEPLEFHHGDCVGADEEAHMIAATRDLLIVIHPPTNPKKRAFCYEKPSRSEVTVLDAFPYLERDKHIVDDSAILIATPKAFKEEQRSGTWATIRYAKKKNKFVYIVWPDGSVDVYCGMEDA